EPDTAPGERNDEKGPQMARVYRLLGARHRSDRLSNQTTGVLIGRDLELGALEGAHRAVTESRQSRHVLIVGEAGVGKHSIVDAFRRRLDPGTHLILRAVGRPGLRESPYALLADLTRDLLGVSEETDSREVKRRID